MAWRSQRSVNATSIASATGMSGDRAAEAQATHRNSASSSRKGARPLRAEAGRAAAPAAGSLCAGHSGRRCCSRTSAWSTAPCTGSRRRAGSSHHAADGPVPPPRSKARRQSRLAAALTGACPTRAALEGNECIVIIGGLLPLSSRFVATPRSQAGRREPGVRLIGRGCGERLSYTLTLRGPKGVLRRAGIDGEETVHHRIPTTRDQEDYRSPGGCSKDIRQRQTSPRDRPTTLQLLFQSKIRGSDIMAADLAQAHASPPCCRNQFDQQGFWCAFADFARHAMLWCCIRGQTASPSTRRSLSPMAAPHFVIDGSGQSGD